MGLEDVIGGARLSQGISEVATQTNFDNYQNQVYDAIGYLDGAGLTDDEIENIVSTGLNPQQIGRFSNELGPQVQKKFVKSVKDNINEILENFGFEGMQALALQYSKEGQELKAYTEAIQNNDQNALRVQTAKKDKDGKVDQKSPYNQLYHSIATDEQIRSIALRDVKRQTDEFFVKNQIGRAHV